MSKVNPFFAPEQFAYEDFVIRSYRPGDGVALRQATIESYEHLRPWMPWATTEVPVEESEERCRRFLGMYLKNEEYVLGVWRGDEVVGGTGFHLRHGPRDLGNAEIGMWIRQSAAGAGLGTQVLRAMLEWGFSDWGWHRLVWKCDTRNVASARVAEKCSLTLEGTLRSDALDMEGNRRDTHVYAILAEDWRRIAEAS